MKFDYDYLACCYSEQTPAERVKAKMKLQLSETGERIVSLHSNSDAFENRFCTELTNTIKNLQKI